MVRSHLTAFAVLLFVSPVFGQSTERSWADITGKFRVEARLTGLSNDKAQLRTSDGRDISVPIERLGKEEKQVIHVFQQASENERNYSAITEHIQRIVVSPMAVAEIYDSLYRNQSSGYAAGFYAGIVNAITGDPKRLAMAKRQIDDTIKSLRAAQLVYPNLHEQTYISALNNRAIIALREGSPDSAASLLTQAAQVSESVPFVVYHNATLLMEAAIQAKSAKTTYLSDDSRAKLANVVALRKPEAPGTHVPRRYMYCNLHDSFDSLLEEQPDPSEAHGPDLPTPDGLIAGYEKLGNGSGFLISDHLIVTNQHVVEGHEYGMQFIIRNATSFDRGELATVVKVSQDEDIDLAVLELKNPKPLIAPIPIRRDSPRDGETIIVLGYPLEDILGEQLQSSRGTVNSVSKNRREIIHDAATNPGNSGGPGIDERGNVIGVHFAGYGRQGSKRNFAVTNELLVNFLRGIQGYLELPPRMNALNTPEVIDLVRDAVVRVEVYGTASQSQLSESAESSPTGGSVLENLSRFGLFVERTCLRCQGTGRFRCHACRNGIVSVTRREPVGINPLNGSPIIGDKVYASKCQNCGGAGGFKCPHCSNGLLPMN